MFVKMVWICAYHFNISLHYSSRIWTTDLRIQVLLGTGSPHLCGDPMWRDWAQGQRDHGSHHQENRRKGHFQLWRRIQTDGAWSPGMPVQVKYCQNMPDFHTFSVSLSNFTRFWYLLFSFLLKICQIFTLLQSSYKNWPDFQKIEFQNLKPSEPERVLKGRRPVSANYR